MAAIAPCPAGTALLHEAAAGADGADGVGEGEGSSGYVGGVFAEGVACGVSGGDAGFGEDTGDGGGDGEDGGLVCSVSLRVLVGAFEDDFREGEA